ncbi:hypothetical protein JHK85_001109 [Glycine max]|uniref:Importin N-terminal domain-containing protein n=1 Tax=Glycine max TaxID=3847 RepID=A0A0R0LFG1_SOYBN|nr:hypothetical protein JHK85_001109 [Glycine max]KAG5088463.1 hypothetical protein JHK86_001075 [Glycine max]
MGNLVDQDQQWLLSCLSATLDPNPEVRCFAEASLDQASRQPGFGSALSKVAANKELVFVKKHWQEGEDSFEPPVVASDEKEIIRRMLLLALDDPHKKICTAIGMAVASIAMHDWPELWPDLLPFLLNLINNQTNMNGVHGAMRCLVLLSVDLDDKMVPTLIPALFPSLLTIVSSPQFFLCRLFRAITPKPLLSKSVFDSNYYPICLTLFAFVFPVSALVCFIFSASVFVSGALGYYPVVYAKGLVCRSTVPHSLTVTALCRLQSVHHSIGICVVMSKKIVSFAYCSMLILTLSEPTGKPLNRFFSTAFLIKPFRPSATTLKRRGANRSPCLSPLCGVNSVEGLPFTRTEIDAYVKHPSIHLIHLELKPVLLRMYDKKSHDTESLFAMRRYGGGMLYAALPLHMQRGCFRIRTHDQQVTKAQLYRCTRARPQRAYVPQNQSTELTFNGLNLLRRPHDTPSSAMAMLGAIATFLHHLYFQASMEFNEYPCSVHPPTVLDVIVHLHHVSHGGHDLLNLFRVPSQYRNAPALYPEICIVYSSPLIDVDATCWNMGCHGVLISTRALSSLWSSSTSSSTSTISVVSLTSCSALLSIYDPYIRMKALSIIYSCTSMLGTMSGVYKAETSSLIVPLLKPWMDQFSSILQIPVQSENPDDWSIKMEVLKCLNQFIQNFSSLFTSEFEVILGPLWNTFVSSLRVYEKASIEGTEDSHEGRYDSDGSEKSLDSFVIQVSCRCSCTIRPSISSINFAVMSISHSKKNLLPWNCHSQPAPDVASSCCYLQLFELMLTIVGNPRLGKVVVANIRELVYYTIAFLQMTEQQVHTWSVDANQFIADEEDATYSCRVSGVLLLEEVVNSFAGEGILAITDGAKQWFTESQIRKAAGVDDFRKLERQLDNLILGGLKLHANLPKHGREWKLIEKTNKISTRGWQQNYGEEVVTEICASNENDIPLVNLVNYTNGKEDMVQQCLGRARVLIKTSWYLTINHTVTASINGDDYVINIVEETCYNPCRCKCNSGSLIGSSEEIFSDESEVGLTLSLEDASSHDESLAIAMLADADGDEQNRSGGEQ